MSAGAASLILLAKRLRGQSSIVDAVLPLAILNIGQFECLLIAFGLNLVVTAWISCALIFAVCRTHESSGGRCLAAGGLIVLLPLCGGSGLAMLPPLILWLAGYIACSWWSGRDPGAGDRRGAIDDNLGDRCLVPERVCEARTRPGRAVGAIGVVDDAGIPEPGDHPVRLGVLATGRFCRLPADRRHGCPSCCRGPACAGRTAAGVGPDRGSVVDDLCRRRRGLVPVGTRPRQRAV